MPERQPEPWQSGAAGPFLWIEGSPVEVWALGEDRFAARAPGREQLVTGLEEAQQAAHVLGKSGDRCPPPAVGPLSCHRELSR